MTNEQILDESIHRLITAKSAQKGLTILLQVGAGNVTETIKGQLKSRLEKESGFKFSSVEQQQEEPVADISVEGGHVHPSQFVIIPYPDLVVSISEYQNQLYIAARLAGSDPLGPPENGWLWVLPEP
ncbi:MAG: hypothetical protein ACU836_13630 [Gammaproteobacteria bacterium]